MSGVLDRMVKQARGVLPTVQPLTAPRFAPVARVSHETFAEVEAETHAVDDPRRKKPRQDEGREAVEERAQPKSESVLPTRELSKPPVRGQMESKKDRTRPQERDEHADQGARQGLDAHIEPGEDPIRAPIRVAASARESEDTVFKETQESTVRAAMIEASEDVAAESATAARRLPRSDEDGAEIETRTNRARLTGPERTELAMEARKAARRDAAAQADALNAAAEQRTEIHISIGSIELRAPRVEAKPQTALFRPQVTLDDYLRRKPEDGA